MINPMDLVDRTILVTGASSGIGRETAILLSQLGARLILVGRSSEQLCKTLSSLEGTAHQVYAFDLSNVDEIHRWMKEVTSAIGPLHGLVHSAGVQFTRPLRIVSSQGIEELMRLNVTAAILLAKAFRQKGVSADSGSIVYLSSVMGLVGQSGQSAYSASKGALVTLTKSLALELSRENIRVNCVAPAMVSTEMTEKMLDLLTPEQVIQIEAMHPLGFGNPRDVANAIAFLLADTGRWITGTTLVVDGGYTAH
ncbi:MAG: SDR family oxidoreductase [Desulfobulbaceae bacterium]|nr:SDR family oxidoreductase [Desulfobulbaceae bacterium]